MPHTRTRQDGTQATLDNDQGFCVLCERGFASDTSFDHHLFIGSRPTRCKNPETMRSMESYTNKYGSTVWRMRRRAKQRGTPKDAPLQSA